MTRGKDLTPITGAMCWRGEDLSKDDGWIREFTDSEIVELEIAVDATMNSPIQDIVSQTFPLPSLAIVLDQVRHELIDGHGFMLLRGLPVNRWSREVTARAYWGICSHIGQPVSQNPDGHLLGHVKDIGGDFHDLHSRGGYRSRARLPFHTDVGADVVALLCLHTAKAGGHSSVVSLAAIYNMMLQQRPDLVAELSVPIYRDRRGEIPPGKSPYYRAPVFCLHEKRLTTTFVRRFIDSAPRHAGVPELTAQLTEALDHFEDIANHTGLRLDMNFKPGDIQLVNNLTTLHARTDYEDFNAPGLKRHLLRLWLAVPDGWPLPEFYYDRFGTLAGSERPAGMALPGVTLSVPLDVT